MSVKYEEKDSSNAEVVQKKDSSVTEKQVEKPVRPNKRASARPSARPNSVTMVDLFSDEKEKKTTVKKQNPAKKQNPDKKQSLVNKAGSPKANRTSAAVSEKEKQASQSFLAKAMEKLMIHVEDDEEEEENWINHELEEAAAPQKAKQRKKTGKKAVKSELEMAAEEAGEVQAEEVNTAAEEKKTAAEEVNAAGEEEKTAAEEVNAAAEEEKTAVKEANERPEETNEEFEEAAGASVRAVKTDFIKKEPVRNSVKGQTKKGTALKRKKKKSREQKILEGAAAAAAAVFVLSQMFRFLVPWTGNGTVKPVGKTIVEEGRAYLQSLNDRGKEDVLSAVETVKKEKKLAELEAGEESAIWSLFDNAVIIGDSRVVGFSFWEFLPESRALAQGGGMITDIPVYLDQLSALQPHNVFLAFGLNDYGIENWPIVEDYIEVYVENVNLLKEVLPDAEIYVNSTLAAVGEGLYASRQYSRIDEYNAGLRAMCEREGYHYIDNDFIGLEHADLYQEDGLHIQQELYPIWARNMLKEVIDL